MNPLKVPNLPPQVAPPTNDPATPNQDPSYLGLDLQQQGILPNDPLAPVEPNGDPNAIPDPQDPSQLQPKDDPRRHEYWQSRHDRLQAQFQQIEPYRAQLEVLRQRPDIANQVLQLAAGVPVQAAPTQPAGPVEPVAPKRPLHYDPTDMNPESESFRYRLAMDDYRDQKLQYLEQKEEMRARAFEDSLAMAAQERQREQAFNQTRAQIATFGLTGPVADEFLNWASSPQIQLEDLVQLFAMRHGRQPNQSHNAQPQADPRALAAAALNQRRQQVLPSLAAVTAQTPNVPPPQDDNQAFSQGFLTAAKRYG